MSENLVDGKVEGEAQGQAQAKAPVQAQVQGQVVAQPPDQAKSTVQAKDQAQVKAPAEGEEKSGGEQKSEAERKPPKGETEIRNYVQDDLLADGRLCALFVAGRASSPVWQYALVYQDLVKSVPGMAMRYADPGVDVFNPDEISSKIANEVKNGEFARYIVVGLGMGGQLVYESLKKLDGEVAQRTTGVLFSTPAGNADIKDSLVINEKFNGNNFMRWILKKDKLARFLDKFRKVFWMMFGEKKSVNDRPDDEIEAYARRRAFESQFPVTTMFAQSRYFYGFRADKPIESRLVIVNAVEDNFIRDHGGWDKLTQNIEHRTIAGGYGDSVLKHGEYARIVADEAGREEQIMKRALANFE